MTSRVTPRQNPWIRGTNGKIPSVVHLSHHRFMSSGVIPGGSTLIAVCPPFPGSREWTDSWRHSTGTHDAGARGGKHGITELLDPVVGHDRVAVSRITKSPVERRDPVRRPGIAVRNVVSKELAIQGRPGKPSQVLCGGLVRPVIHDDQPVPVFSSRPLDRLETTADIVKRVVNADDDIDLSCHLTANPLHLDLGVRRPA